MAETSEPRPPAPEHFSAEVPDVIGYTEAAARRLLARNGLQADVVDQATDNSSEVDRVIDQSPRRGTEAARKHNQQDPVVLFLGRGSGSGGD